MIQDLKKILGAEKVLSNKSECLAYSRDMSIYSAIPDVVVLPQSTQDVQKAVFYASHKGIPITPRGAGTSVTGAVIPVRGGMVLDLSGMNRIKEINAAEKYAVVEPGVICGRLNASLVPDYFFPPDPGSADIATIGGMISTNASGKSALKYGATGDYLLGVEAVLASGEIVRPGHRTAKASAGFDITRLFVAAEGTLGIITEATLRIVRRPQSIALCVAGFLSLEAAAQTTQLILAGDTTLCACEIMDCLSTQEFSRGIGLDFRGAGGFLLLEVDGDSQLVSSKIQEISRICEQSGALMVHVALDPVERTKVWRLRNRLISSLNPSTSQSRLIPMAEDIGVPISRISEAIQRTKALSELHDIPVVLFGHAGDGNIHTTFIINPEDRRTWERAGKLAEELNNLAMELGGTISAEHGIGLAKARFIRHALGESHDVMKRIKRLLDPQDIMNPDKLGFGKGNSAELDHFVFAAPAQNPSGLFSFGNESADSGSLLCMMCGCCRSVCPVFAVTGKESDNTRSIVQLAYRLRTGDVELSPEFALSFFRCMECAACQQNCPAGISITELVHAARNKIFETGLLPAVLAETVDSIKSYGNPFGRMLAGEADLDLFPLDCSASGELSTIMQSGKDGHRVNLSLPSLHTRDLGPTGAAEVLLFPGCASLHTGKKTLFSLIEILKLAGVKYVLPERLDQCCGFPLFRIGDDTGFMSHAERYATLIPEDNTYPIVTPCPGCLKAFKEIYPSILRGWNHEAFSVVEFLDALILSDRLQFRRPVGRKVVYHDPCILARHLGIIHEPRRILNGMPGISLFELSSSRENTLCCGGGLPKVAPEIASEMATRVVQAALEVGVDTLVTACPAGKCHLAKSLAQANRNRIHIDLVDIIEIVHTALR